MKAISIVRPGGSLIAAGKTTLEVHRWRPLLPFGESLLIVESNCFLEGEDEDRGAAVAIVRVAAWELDDVRPLAAPIPAVARRRIYDVELPAGGIVD